MAGTNDAMNKGPDQIVNELVALKDHVENTVPGCSVTISWPTMRNDKKFPIAQRTVFDMRKKLINLKIPLILNENINEVHIGLKGLHLNKHGKGRLALNFKRYMRSSH